MPDEIEDKTDATEDVEQPEALDEDLPTELPDDPVELKKIAETAISRITAAQEREAQLQSDKERLEDNLEEQRTKANFWSVKAQELETQVKSKKPVAEESKTSIEAALDDDNTELAVLVQEGMTLKDFDRRAERIAKRIADQTATHLAQQGAVANTLTTTYPDLRDTNSPLAKATVAEMARIDEENPGMGDAAKFELATLRSAGRLGIAPKAQSNGDKTNGNEQKERERRRNAQGGPTGKPAPSKGAVVITDADRAEARRMNGGQDVPDAVLKNAKKFEQERQQARDARA